VDIYIGPKPPAGQESNWFYTPSGQAWFPWFRVYGPEKAVFDKTWRLPDIEKLHPSSLSGMTVHSAPKAVLSNRETRIS
jgi:Protein of unknown function (DUF1214)